NRPEAPAPAGPPLTGGEREGFRVAISRCWNVGSLSTDALATTVVVAVEMEQSGKPITGSIRLVSSSGGSSSGERQAFEAARRAIIRCGASGFGLPVEKFDQWREIEMTFNPEGMQFR
ncbi:MAG: energy transducer TonB, partial [Silicimonas sp.]|nr:energy transducer TonB [Silicimonas sp.]